MPPTFRIEEATEEEEEENRKVLTLRPYAVKNFIHINKTLILEEVTIKKTFIIIQFLQKSCKF